MTIETGIGLFLLGSIVTILGLGIAFYFGAKENKNNN